LSQFKGKAANTSAPVDGLLDARAVLDGTGDSVHDVMADASGRLSVIIPGGDVRSAFAELTGVDVARGLGILLKGANDRDPLRCGVAQFDVEHGTAHVQALVFDTQDVLITGDGQVYLGPEKLDLSIHGQPKKVRFLRLRTPIQIKGQLLKPSFGLDAGQVLKQGAIATALATLLSPLAAIVAFVDPGLAKDQNCAQLLEQAQQKSPDTMIGRTADGRLESKKR
jgi:AsmA family protein